MLLGTDTCSKIDVEFQTFGSVKIEQDQVENLIGQQSFNHQKIIKLEDFGSLEYDEDVPEILEKHEIEEMPLKNEELIVKEGEAAIDHNM